MWKFPKCDILRCYRLGFQLLNPGLICQETSNENVNQCNSISSMVLESFVAYLSCMLMLDTITTFLLASLHNQDLSHSWIGLVQWRIQKPHTLRAAHCCHQGQFNWPEVYGYWVYTLGEVIPRKLLKNQHRSVHPNLKIKHVWIFF